MADFINTIDVLGDDAVIDSIIDRTITEFKDNTVVTVVRNVFRGCAALETVDMPNVTCIESSAFYGCKSLKSINFANAIEAKESSFESCNSLSEVVMPNLTKFSTAFGSCFAIRTLDLPKLTYFSGKFGNWNSTACLDTFILRSETMCVMGSAEALGKFGATATNTAIAKGTGYIYVPRALVDSYKAATNWSVYATQFRALEDYTVDGTITGALDETKI